ncbi:hypothetical protein DOTSEDRAFT_135975 [Dothistroma septosporum NZE10]|uniref:Amidase domain-containing protein n=1 Tax=Dothistroma septosporum (strain NZE10 / CBS 128990) TaxID=675120 RepID=N1PGG4_DOTSN|nr:hypothetical protein DOTSEDRAFT_135975 [Dothistroma septosporum NZE10]
MEWQSVCTGKQAELWEHVPAQWNIGDRVSYSDADTSQPHATIQSSLNFTERTITERSAAALLDAMGRGEYTVQEVLAAFAHRAMVAHQLTLCLCEVNFVAARSRARELDRYWQTNRKTIGPLHGLPVSLMDRFHVAGLDTACGFASWCDQRKSIEDEGTLVRTLKQLGAIVHCKTNVPMSMLLGETSNNIIGTTVNPHDTRLTAGGACGGEGALLALRGSILGLGTDVAGSSRIPAAFCGIWSLKCSQDRLPSDGIATVLSGLPVAHGAIGLMSNELAMLTKTLYSLLNSHIGQTDPDVIEIPWNQERLDSIRQRKGHAGQRDGRLCFGVLACDAHVRPHPPILRAIQEVSNALRQSGHEVVEWAPPPHAPAVENLFKILGSTSAIEARQALDASGEPSIPQLHEWYENQDMEPNSTAEFWNLCAERKRYCAQYKSYWHSVGDSTGSGRVPDGVVLPVAPTLAVSHGKVSYYGYSAIANVLDYPSGVFPVTTADLMLDISMTQHDILSDTDAEVQRSYDPSVIEGLPVNLQVMCPRFQEETVLGLMEVIAESLQQSDTA